MEKADPEAFDPSDKLKFLANTSRLYYDANRMLMLVPHSVHGLTTHGPGIDTKQVPSASATASQIAGDTIVPHRNMMLSTIQNGVDVTKDMSVQEVMTALGFDHDEDDELYEQHKELAQKIIDSAPEEGGLRALTHGSLLSLSLIHI